jgi:hypothetical protein
LPFSFLPSLPSLSSFPSISTSTLTLNHTATNFLPEQAAESLKQAVPETKGEAKGQANEVAGQAKGKANELAGEAKGKAQELKGEAKARGY